MVKVDGKDVTPEQTLSFIVANIAPGKRIPIDLIRDGKRMTVTAVVGKRPSEEELASSELRTPPAEDADPFANPPTKQGEGLVERSLGLSVLPITPQIARQLRRARSDARAGGQRCRRFVRCRRTKGLQRGDIILSANYRDVNSVGRPGSRGARSRRPAAAPQSCCASSAAASRPAYIPVRIR